MSLSFQSLCSGSSGNSLLLKTPQTTLLIDAGFPTMKACRKALGRHLQGIHGAVISHLHTDHIHHYSLRVLEDCRIPLYVYQKSIRPLAGRHSASSPFLELKIHPFLERPFHIRELTIVPFPVPHDKGLPTFGFQIWVPENGRRRKVVVATDFRDWQGLSPWFENADFIYVEANHDPVLLRAHPNPHSHYHLSNEKCGRLLQQVLSSSKILPGAVMLGHLSAIRNRPKLARDTVLEMLDGGPHRHIPLHVAPRYEPSPEIEIGT